MKNSKYQCIRCGYTTVQKNSMKDHMYNRKTLCATTLNDIELTDEIKKHIVDFRVYQIHKEPKKVVHKKIVLDDLNKGSIYIFYSRACKNADEPIYKIGKTGNYIQRKSGYDKGGDMLFVANVENRHDSENILKQVFKNEFIQRRDYGVEYFEGDIMEMVILLEETLKEQINEVVISFECKAVSL